MPKATATPLTMNPRDVELRKTALDEAVRLSINSGDQGLPTTIARADAFYKFLRDGTVPIEA